MAKTPSSVPLMIFILFLLSSSSGTVMKLALAQRTWCVAKPSANEQVLSDILQYSCFYVKCDVVNPGGKCFYPNTTISHASVVMNLYYNNVGGHPLNCNFNNSGQSYGLITISDPSFGSCVFI